MLVSLSLYFAHSKILHMLCHFTNSKTSPEADQISFSLTAETADSEAACEAQIAEAMPRCGPWRTAQRKTWDFLLAAVLLARPVFRHDSLSDA